MFKYSHFSLHFRTFLELFSVNAEDVFGDLVGGDDARNAVQGRNQPVGGLLQESPAYLAAAGD